MEEKNTFGTKLEAFFAGKGFYIVLLLCVAVIGVSAWSMLSGGGVADSPSDLALSVASIDEDAVTTARTAPVTVTEPPALAENADAETGDAAGIVPEQPAVAEEPLQAAAASEPVASYFIWPVSGDTAREYAMTELRYDRTMRDWRTHDGVDLAAEKGAQVRAAASGTVKSVYFDERLGTTVVLNHGGGLESVYANLAATPTVSAGDWVGVGDVLGAVGDTALFEIGEVSHLHFAMSLNGESVDPNDYLP